MSPMPIPPFREVVTGDFEFRIIPGGLPRVACAVFRELYSGREWRLGRGELLSMRQAPFDVEKDLFVGFYASAEIGCFLELGWPPPRNIVDLFAEHRVVTNGLLLKRARQKTESQSGKTHKANGRDSLLNALAIRGLGHLDVDTKDEMRNLILTKDWEEMSPEEHAQILAYCASDVVGTEALFRYMVEHNQ
jgi:DNA polymerase-1